MPTDADVEEAVASRRRHVRGVAAPAGRRALRGARSTSRGDSPRRVDENAELIAREGGKPLKWAKVEATRAVSTFRWASEEIRHGDDELMRLDTEPAGRPGRHAAPVPDRAGAGDHAVQLPAEPGGAQGRAVARRSARPSS